MSDKPQYRIHGLSELSGRNEPRVKLQPINRITADPPPEQGRIPWNKAIQAIEQPHLNNYLYSFDQKTLGKLWPTFSFLDPWMRRPIKTMPLALAEYFDHGDNDPFVTDIRVEHESQSQEIKNLKQIVAKSRNDQEPTTGNLSPIASAFAAELYRGSRWLKKHRELIFLKICQHPAAAYVALKSGVWPTDKERLIQALAVDPLLLLRLWKSSGWGETVDHSLVLAALKAAPHLHCLAIHPQVQMSEDEAWNNLITAAKENTMAAAFALALQPCHELATVWQRQIKSDPCAMYWAVRAGGSGEDRKQLPYWETFRQIVRVHPRWGYHWHRDFEPGSAYDFAQWHWPDPWAVEIAADLALSKDWCVKNHQELKIELPTKDPLLVAIILWTADYTLTSDEND
ncbi:MAG: hypothetical protein LV481_02330 [Methylacidiphilales bacterium]|nr:hypothetical protein [Candidatus Methylacidiphilales bacterium]